MTPLLRRLAVLGVVAAAAVLACTEDLTAPGRCDQYCPPEKIVVYDTILDSAITRDSAYGRPIGYVSVPEAPVMLVESLPGRISRAIFRFNRAPFLRRAARLRRLRKDSYSAPFLGRARLRRLRKDFHSASFLRGHDFAGCEKTLHFAKSGRARLQSCR